MDPFAHVELLWDRHVVVDLGTIVVEAGQYHHHDIGALKELGDLGLLSEAAHKQSGTQMLVPKVNMWNEAMMLGGA